MSQMFMGNVSDSVDIGTDIPEPMEAWADALISAAVSGITDDIKDALLDCFAHVAWIDDQGQTYYDALEDALYPPVPVSSVTVTPSTFQISSIGGTQQLTATILPSSAQATVSWSSSDTSVATVSESGLVTSVAVGTATITATADGVTGTAACTVALPTLSSISAVYTQSGTVYTTDSLDSLKSDLVVTATWSDTSTSTVAAADYTLSGTLTAGTSTITVSYGGKTTTFTVTVTKVIDYSEDALTNATWYTDGYSYDTSTGQRTDTTSNMHCTDKFSVQDCIYQAKSTNTSDADQTLLCWDENGNYVGFYKGYGGNRVLRAHFPSTYMCAFQMINTGSNFDSTTCTMLPVDNRTTAVNQFSVDLYNYINDFTGATGGYQNTSYVFTLPTSALNLKDYGLDENSYLTKINHVDQLFVGQASYWDVKLTGGLVVMINPEWSSPRGAKLMWILDGCTSVADMQTYITNNRPVITFN